MISMLRILLIVVIANILQFDYAFAYCENPPAKLCRLLFSNDLVIHATVVKTEIFKDKDDPEGIAGWLYHMKVLKSYRGKPGNTVIIRSENATDRLLLTTGKEYIVFARRDRAGNYNAGNYCGGIQSVDGQPYSKELETEIEMLLKSTGPSVIEGEVRNKEFNLIAGSILTITGNDISKTVTVNQQGFRVEVPPGTYKVIFPKNLEVTIYSPDGQNTDLSSNEIPPKSLVSGQCMQIQLQEKRYR